MHILSCPTTVRNDLSASTQHHITRKCWHTTLVTCYQYYPLKKNSVQNDRTITSSLKYDFSSA